MGYNIFVFLVAVAGVAAVLYSSFQISRHRVYAIGIVRRKVSKEESELGLSDYSSHEDTSLATAKLLNLARTSVTSRSKTHRTWYCYKCGSVQEYAAHPHVNHCLNPDCSECEGSGGFEFDSGSERASATEKSIESHGKILQAHTRMLHDFEFRLRKVEVKSMESAQSQEESQAATG